MASHYIMCSTFAASHILADSCDFFTHILLCRFAGGVGYTEYGIFPTFSLQISNKQKNWFSLGFHVNWHKLTSKPPEANSGTHANIYQGLILNLGLNHMQHAILTRNQTKNMWFVPLIRNMNCAITYIYVHKNLSCWWQVHPWFKDKYIGADHPCVCLTVACPTNWKRSWQVFMGSLFNPLLNEFRNC